MSSIEGPAIIHGPPVLRPAPKTSLGLKILNSLKTNANQELIDITNGQRINFEHLLESSCKVANFLVDFGLQQGDVIAICSANSVHFHKPFLAALYTGVVAALINHSYTQNELQHALDIAKPKIVFCSRATLAAVQPLLERSCYLQKVIVLEDLNLAVQDYGRDFAPVALNPNEATAAILYSSGTTGFSKAVMITHANFSYTCNNIIDPKLRLISDRPFAVVPFYHIIGLTISMVPLIHGHRLLFLEKFDVKLYLETLEKYQITNLLVVPPLMVLLANSPIVNNYKLCIDTILCGASSLRKNLEDAVMKRLNVSCVRQAYGLTETTMCVLSLPNGETKPGSCGFVLPGCSIKIRDPETDKTLGPNEVGELCVKGPGVMKGYYNNAEATKNTFTEDGWLLTGDLAYYDEDKYFYIVDRLKELIKYKGFQVAPAELEALLLTHPKIVDAAVVGLPNESAGELPAAFVVTQPGVHLTDEEVKTFVADQVSYPKHLRGGVHFVEKIPKNASGKILRKELRLLLKP